MPGASWSLGVRGSRNLEGRKRRLKIIRKGRVRREELGNGGRRARRSRETVMHPSLPGAAAAARLRTRVRSPPTAPPVPRAARRLAAPSVRPPHDVARARAGTRSSAAARVWPRDQPKGPGPPTWVSSWGPPRARPPAPCGLIVATEAKRQREMEAGRLGGVRGEARETVETRKKQREGTGLSPSRPAPEIMPHWLADSFCWEASVYPSIVYRSIVCPWGGGGGGLQGLFPPPSSSGDDSRRVPHSFEEPGGRCQPSLFLQQLPLPRSPLGSSAPVPPLAPGPPSPQGPPTTALLHRKLPSPVMSQPHCATPSPGSPPPRPSSPLPFCSPRLLRPASTPRLPQTRLPAPPVQCPGAPSPRNPPPGLQFPHPNPRGHPTLCPCSPRLGTWPRVAPPRPQGLCGDWLAGLNGELKAKSRLRMSRSRVPKGQWM